MIPLNDAIIAAAVFNVIAAALTWLCCRIAWQGKVDQAREDGHARGVEEQQRWYRRAEARERLWAVDDTTIIHPPLPSMIPLAVVLDPFPAGLPDIDRAWVQQLMGLPAADPPRMLP